MCDNQNMEKKSEEVKMLHSQHARILKEDDEIWISSEDLNTENSSDEDRSKTKHAFKKKLKLKTRKRSSPNIKLQRPSIPSIPSTSKELDDRLLMPSTDDIHSRSTDESRTSDEEYHIPPISTECLSKRLSLEDWRPMRGALNISPSIEDSSSSAGKARKIVNESGNFYNAMLYKLKSLKSCSVLSSARKEKLLVNERDPVVEKTFKYLKNTPEVRQKLDCINKLDEEINATISQYKAEREDRLATEFQMCKLIHDQKNCEDRDTDVFLRMCNFEDRLKNYLKGAEEFELIKGSEQSEDIASASENESEDDTDAVKEDHDVTLRSTDDVDDVHYEEEDKHFMNSTNFVRKNIYAAKEGTMAGFCLTDEEKAHIAEILKDIDNFEMNDAGLILSEGSHEESFDNHVENQLVEEKINGNAFSLPRGDKTRMGEIDSELEKFAEDQESNEKIKKPVPVVKDDEFWKKYVFDQSLKEIDEKLEKLYVSYLEDDEKLKRNFDDEKQQDDEHKDQTGELTTEIEVEG